MNTEILEELGLGKGDVKIYLTLLELGNTKVGAIIERSGMASSAVHNSINYLVEKGFASFIKKGKIKFYQAIPPKYLVDFLDEKKKRLQNIIPELENHRIKSFDEQESEIFEGTKGIISMLNSLIDNVKKGDEYLFFAIDVQEHNKEIQNFLANYDVKRKERGLKIKGIVNPNLKELFNKRKFIKMKYTTFPILSNISICRNKVAIFTWEEKPIGYLIKSKQISQIYHDYFNKVWEMVNL